jgi:hypothetical protein
MIYPNTGLTGPIMGAFVGVSIVGLVSTIYYGLMTLYHALRSNLSTAWAAYGAKTKEILVVFLGALAGVVGSGTYRWLIYGFVW